MKIAHRANGSILAYGSAITKEADRLHVERGDGHRYDLVYKGFGDGTLTDTAITIVDYEGAAPARFKADASHTWNGSAPAATDYEFPEEAERIVHYKRLDKTDFNELCYAALGALALPAGDALEKYAAGMGAFQTALEAAAAHPESATIRGAARHFNDTQGFVKAKVELFFGILISAGIISLQQAGVVFAAWPEEQA